MNEGNDLASSREEIHLRPTCLAACSTMGVIKRWQRRVEARAQQEREEQGRANVLMANVPDVAVFGPDAVRVRFEVRPSGELRALQMEGLEFLVDFLGATVGSLLFRGGFTVHVEARGHRRRKLRYPDRLSALADVPRLVSTVESGGVVALNLRHRHWAHR